MRAGSSWNRFRASSSAKASSRITPHLGECQFQRMAPLRPDVAFLSVRLGLLVAPLALGRGVERLGALAVVDGLIWLGVMRGPLAE